MKLIDLIAGARPNFMKIAPIIDAIKAAQVKGSKLRYRLIHTGQHYDKAMSASFFEQLDIPEPEINLGAGSGTQAEQTSAIMMGYERVLARGKSDLCLVVGDVTSTMACAITSRKCLIPVAHVEGGIRSGDFTMPEEINRIVTDSVTNWFFTTTRTANSNLLAAGVSRNRIFFVGNTMIDTLLKHSPRFTPPSFWGKFGLRPGAYLVLTLHRPSNVDDNGKLYAYLKALEEGAKGMPIVFPVHPRTERKLKTIIRDFPSLCCVPPQGYLEFNYLVKNSKGVITDSGGITEETTVMGIPCVTLRDNTERPETITIGTNELVGTDPKKIMPALKKLLSGNWKEGKVPEKWDGRAAGRIVAALERLLS